jgi:AraC-like DNA-binding protein
MPSAPQIRKLLLNVLNQEIIPLLQAQAVPQILASPEYDLSGVECEVVQKAPLPNLAKNPLDMNAGWENQKLGVRRMALLGIGYSGASLEKVGVTQQMAQSLKKKKLPVPPGVTAFRLVAPAVLYVPSLVPHGGVSLPESRYGASRMLILWFTEHDFWVGHHDAVKGGTHILHIADAACRQLEQSYVRLLEQREFWAAQLVLLDLVKRLAVYLAEHSAIVSNSAWPPFGEKAILVGPHVCPRSAQYCYKVVDYIQLHLHTPLSLRVLAEVCGVTVPYLSSVFRKSTGIPLMQYVTQSRLRAAEMMLSETQESIGDIARLAGFASSHSFDGVFRRAHGMGPTQYRRWKRDECCPTA